MSRVVVVYRLERSCPLAGPVAWRSLARIARKHGRPAPSLPMHLCLMSLAPSAPLTHGVQL